MENKIKNKIAKGITEVIVDGKKTYKVYVCKRAIIDSKLTKFERKQTCKTKHEALKVYDKLTESIIRDIAKKEGLEKSWLTLINEWKKYHFTNKYKDISETTVQDYSSLLKNWTYDWMNTPSNEITKQMVKIAIERIKKDRSIKHTAKLKDAIKSVFQWAISHEVIKGLIESPTHGVSVSRKTIRLTEVLTEDVAKKLLSSAKNQAHPWYPIWGMALFTGMRNGELYALKWDKIDFQGRTIRINEAFKARTGAFGTTKTGGERIVPINDELMALLIDLKSSNQDSAFVLPRLKDWQGKKQALVLKTFCESIKIKPIRFHSLRATFTTLLLSKGVGLNVVQSIGGWSDIATMNHYNRMAGVMVANATDSLRLIE